jgi:hypothetical protein
MSVDTAKKEPCEAELRALYDIRVKEMHHYNTIIWAFPIAYATLLAAELRFIDAGSWSLVAAAIFNVALWYVFWRHLQYRQSIQLVLRFTEKKLGQIYGDEFVPDFSKSDSALRATIVMHWAIVAVTILFAFRAFSTLCLL